MTKTLIKIGLNYLGKQRPKKFPVEISEMNSIGYEIDSDINKLSPKQKQELRITIINMIGILERELN